MLFRHDFLLRLSTNNMDSSDSRVSVKMLKKKATRGIRTRNQGMEGCVPNQLRHRGSSGGRNRSNRSLDREIRFATGALPRVPDSVPVDFYIIIVSTIPPALMRFTTLSHMSLWVQNFFTVFLTGMIIPLAIAKGIIIPVRNTVKKFWTQSDI